MTSPVDRPGLVVQVDIPSIKSYVFGTDPLNEIRGASATLDWLNRRRMEVLLRDHICGATPTATIEKVYANGGSGQFLVRGCIESVVETACRQLVRYMRDKTGGEVRAVYGIAGTALGKPYREAVRKAHFRLRCRREFGSVCFVPPTLPLAMECGSSSHLPATNRVNSADGMLMLSEASRRKAARGRAARGKGVWSEWMQYLQKEIPWADEQDWEDLRCGSLMDIGRTSNNHVGVVYADGDAMGRLVRAISSPAVYREFSRIVDRSIREACFVGLSRICNDHIGQVSEAVGKSGRFRPLPVDILLLGGDDLLVAVPATKALDFALHVAVEFERLTAAKVGCLPNGETRRFFQDKLSKSGLTVSCGVAIAGSTYPFYLLLELAEQLLQSAKQGDPTRSVPSGSDGARIDFHVVAGSTSQDLKHIREAEYRSVTLDSRRTMRPLSCSQLEALRTSVRELRDSRFPRGKLKELQDAAFSATAQQASFHVRDIFARARHGRVRSERAALWNAVSRLCPKGHRFDFPWFRDGSRRTLCVADIVDAYDLFAG